MAFTYVVADLATSELYRIRLKIGDTDSFNQLLQDEEILTIIGSPDSRGVASAAVRCCYAILAKLARDTDSNGAGISVSRSQKVQHYRDLIGLLEREAVLETAPTAGALDIDAAKNAAADTSFKKPIFSIGMDDHP